jgi:hypothetical protein
LRLWRTAALPDSRRHSPLLPRYIWLCTECPTLFPSFWGTRALCQILSCFREAFAARRGGVRADGGRGGGVQSPSKTSNCQ